VTPLTYGRGRAAPTNPFLSIRYTCRRCDRDFGDIDSLDMHATTVHQSPLTLKQLAQLARAAESYRKEVEARALAIRAGAPPPSDLNSWSPWRRSRARKVDAAAQEWIRREDEHARENAMAEAARRAAEENRARERERERLQAACERETAAREAERVRAEEALAAELAHAERVRAAPLVGLAGLLGRADLDARQYEAAVAEAARAERIAAEWETAREIPRVVWDPHQTIRLPIATTRAPPPAPFVRLPIATTRAPPPAPFVRASLLGKEFGGRSLPPVRPSARADPEEARAHRARAPARPRQPGAAVRGRPRSVPDEVRSQIVARARLGAKPGEIAREFKVNENTVRTIVRRDARSVQTRSEG